MIYQNKFSKITYLVILNVIWLWLANSTQQLNNNCKPPSDYENNAVSSA